MLKCGDFFKSNLVKGFTGANERSTFHFVLKSNYCTGNFLTPSRLILDHHRGFI